jgi:hypothetical protein
MTDSRSRWRPASNRPRGGLLAVALLAGNVSLAASATVVIRDGVDVWADTTLGQCFRRPAVWQTPPEILLASPLTTMGAFGILVDPELDNRVRGAAESGLRRWLGLDEVLVRPAGIRLQKAYGERLTVRSATGIGPAAEDAVEAEYRLWRAWYLRSEARERGETVMELRRELLFW